MRSLLPLCADGPVLALTTCSATEDLEDKRFTEPLTIWADEDRALAADFARAFVTDPEFSVILHETDPRVPTLTAALDILSEQHPDLQEFQRADEGGLPMPAIPGMEAVWSPFSQASADIIGGSDPAEAPAEAEQQIVAGFE